MSYSPTVVKSTQNGTLTITRSFTANSVTITGVDPAKTSLFFLGYTANAATNTAQAEYFTRITLASSTVVTATRDSIPTYNITVTAGFRVVEMY